jgi:hypothetical protein
MFQGFSAGLVRKWRIEYIVHCNLDYRYWRPTQKHLALLHCRPSWELRSPKPL